MKTSSGHDRRLAVSIFISLYLAAHALFFVLNALGDVQVHPIAYFFTWDMFPGYYGESVRRVAIGQTRSGAYVQVYPNPAQQFRGGVHGDMTRADLDRLGVRFPGLVEHGERWAAGQLADDPLVHVTLLEEFRASRFNLPADLDEPWAGQRREPVRYWRVVAERELSP